MARVLLYTDEPVLAEGFLNTLRGLQDFTPDVLILSDAPQKPDLDRLAPDILLLDMGQSVTYGVLTELRQNNPGCRIVLWVRSIPRELAHQAMALGVRGILRKNLPVELFLKCLRKVYEGEVWFEKSLTSAFFAAPVVRLTKREGQLVSLLAQGMKNKEIAFQLGLSEGTVKVYLSRLFEKLGVKDRFELALYGLRNLTTGSMALDGNSKKPIGSEGVPELRDLVMG